MRTFAAPLLALTTALLCQSSVAESKPVQVYLMMGQSNMFGEGTIAGDKNGTLEYAVKTEHKYPYLLDKNGNWTVLPETRNVFVSGNGNNTGEGIIHNEWMTVSGKTIGPELGIGFHMDSAIGGPAMFLKSCIGNRALGWDLLPPGSPGFEYVDSKNVTHEYAGYHQTPENWVKGTTPVPVKWEAGEQYDGDTARMDGILANLTTYYPNATDYEVAGFFWWQGDRDSRDMALAGRYEYNLVNLIKALRKRYNAPNAKFVTASLGQTVKGDTDGGGLILDAMLAVDGTSGKYPEFKGNVAAVYTHPLSMGSASGSHYGHNAETYMNIGQAMGDAMAGLLK